MTFLKMLSSPEVYFLNREGASKQDRGTFRQLTEALFADMGWKIKIDCLVNGRYVGIAHRRGRERLRGHQRMTRDEAELDLLVAFHCGLSSSYRERYFSVSPELASRSPSRFLSGQQR